MSSTHVVRIGTPRMLRISIVGHLVIVALILCITWLASPTAIAAVYTYTPTNTAADLWSAGADWNMIPVSNPSTELTFVGNNTTVLPNNLTNIGTDDIAGAFSLNILDLQGTGPAKGAATININSSSPSDFLNFVSNGATAPVVNLNAHCWQYWPHLQR